MTRVDESREAQRLDEQRRLEKQDQTKRNENAQQFAKVVANKQQATAKASTKQGEKNLGQKTTGDRQNNALAARAGIASNRFGNQLQKQGQQNVKDKDSQQKTRQSEFKESERSSEAKQQKIDQAQQGQHADQLAPISRDDRRGSGSGGGAGESESGGNKEQQKSLMASSDPTAAMQRETQGAQSAQAPQGTQAPKMPPAMLQEIVNRVLVGLNKEGLSEMHIEFKEGVLGGGSLQISSKDGKVSAKFTVGDQNTKRLLRASQGELERAFEQKGLALESFDVQTHA
jgi:hypothetical protein